MINDLGKYELTKILINSFGKHTFTENELDEHFWSDFYLAAGDFFRIDTGHFNLDFFWSEDIRNWLVYDKEAWLFENYPDLLRNVE